ncbi:MAG: acetyl-CoA carboxylase biotin carboxyl carrier protein subunit [Bacteroidaceae bacterium]|nr:acetyl-CoA carboxylase biotin carboxyl carrier protein subunit [Bacteroidaceae bacterium]
MKDYKYTINGKEYKVTIGDIENNIANITVNGEDYKVEMEKEQEPEKKKVVVRPVAAAPAAASVSSPAAAGNVNTKNAVKAPLPGVIVKVCVEVGQVVKSGETVVVLEAMKMANNLTAEKDGTVSAILVKEGDSVMEGTALVAFE